MMKPFRKHLVNAFAVVFIGFLIFAAWGFCHTESYCFFWPSIDTRYAPGYLEESFSELRVGMTMTEVNQIMCHPLAICTNGQGMVKVFYTSDGNAPFGDFAWFGKSLYVSNGIVTEIINRIYYD